jgi:hypothetical protein
MKKLRKLFGYTFIILSILFGITAIGIAEWDQPIVSILLYLLIGILPFSLGAVILEGKQELVKTFWFKFRLYTGITIFIPLILQLLDYLGDVEKNRLATPSDIYLDFTAMPVWLEYLVVFAGITAVFSLISIYITWFNASKNVYLMFVLSIVLTILIPLLVRDNFRAIREEGIAFSLQGKDTEIPWKEVEKVFLSGFISRDGFHHTSTSSFKWEYIFYLKDGSEERFGPFSYTDYHLEASHQIKGIIMKKRIAMSTDALTEKEWDFVEIDMDYEDADRQDFYELFQYNPEKEAYYDLRYE